MRSLLFGAAFFCLQKINFTLADKKIIGMKKVLLFVIALLATWSVFGQGVRFESGTFEDALLKARSGDKPLFVYVYTSWSTPCSMMRTEVLSAGSVGKLYNEHFLCVKVNVEDPEGESLADKYRIPGTPTFLYLKPDGSVYFRVMGYMTETAFLKQSQYALSEFTDPKPIETWVKQYRTHRSDTAFLRAYLLKRNSLRLPSVEQLDAYIKALPPRLRTPQVLGAFYKQESSNLRVHSQAFDFLLEQEAEMAAVLGPSVYKTLDDAVGSTAVDAASTRDLNMLRRAQLAFRKLDPSKTLLAPEYLNAQYYKRTGEVKKCMKQVFDLCEGRLMNLSVDSLERWDAAEAASEKPFGVLKPRSKKAETANWLHKFAREVCTTSSWNDTLATALRWSERSLELYPENTTFMSTKAILLYKLGKRNEALWVERKALSLIKPDSEEALAHQELVRKMKAGEKVWE